MQLPTDATLFNDVTSSAAAPEPLPTLRLVVTGHVDHGKSTLIGRLLHDTDALPEGKEASIRAACKRRGMPFEFGFLLDALQAERDQGITIDTTQIWFRTAARTVVIIDAPGHRDFVRNMLTGAAQADAAILVVDAEEGVREQTRRHGALLALIGVRQVVVAVNKMDRTGYDRAAFARLAEDLRAYLARLDLSPSAIVPVTARDGDNIAGRSDRMAWYDGPTVLQAMDGLAVETDPANTPLRLPIQDIYKFDERRILVGRVESGRLAAGDTLLFSPHNVTARVKRLEGWPDLPGQVAGAGQTVGFTLEDQVFVERGSLASHAGRPPKESDVCRARILWLDRAPLLAGRALTLRLTTASHAVTVQSIDGVTDLDSLDLAPAGSVPQLALGHVTLRSARMMALDDDPTLPRTGRFALVDGDRVVAAGRASMAGYADQRALVTMKGTNLAAVAHRVDAAQRRARNGHAGAVIWLTGLSGAGKSTIAIEAESRLFAAGFQVYVLDGDNLRTGLNANLGFSPEDRAENIRRVGEVAALMADAGMVVVTAFISPYRSDRERARKAAGDRFCEVHVAADLETCEDRDPKGLYARARAGEIRDFTGIDAPYEPPEVADLVLDTGAESVEDSVARLVAFVQQRVGLPGA